MTLMPERAIWWVKRDVRLADNACLVAAHEAGLEVVPLFCVEPSVLAAEDSSALHSQAQWQAVVSLRQALRERQSDIVIAHGEMVEKLAKLSTRLPFTHLFAHEEIGNDLTFSRDRAVAAWCRDRGVEYREFPQSSVRRGGVNRDRLQRLWQSRIIDQPPLPVPPIRQSDESRQLAAITAFPPLPAFTGNHLWKHTTPQNSRTERLHARLWLQEFLRVPSTIR